RAVPLRGGRPDPPLGVGTTLHADPFHRRICVRSRGNPLLRSVNVPTAQALPDETAATPVSMSSSFAWSGLGTTTQLVPFQCRISVLSGRKLPVAVSMLQPTAHTSPVLRAATALSTCRAPVNWLGLSALRLRTLSR